MSEISNEEVLQMGLALFVALGCFPDVALKSLARGDEEALHTVKTYASLVLDQRRSAENAPLN